MKCKAADIILGALILSFAGCSAVKTYVTDSRPLERQVAIDGRSDDWLGALSIVADAHLEEGFLNDQNFLYICFATEDESLLKQIAGEGLTVWFDPKGGAEKVLGIKYPLGVKRTGRPGRPSEEKGGSPPETPAEGTESSLEIHRAGEAAPQKLDLAAGQGLELAASREAGFFVYELKIPLQPSAEHPIAVGAIPGQTVGVGFSVAKSELGQRGGRPSGEPGDVGGRGGFGGGMRGGGMEGGGRGGMGRGTGGRGMEPDIPSGLKIWTYVKLAAGRTLAPALPVR
jgi:hypothetical protein